ncbi:MAG: ATP-binding protein, partial [Candidatus Diapherotrites archaeon]|nr:ATP-binding protein [Candidatus Diapherotrites archaeon]
MVLKTLTEWNSWWKTGKVDRELMGEPRKKTAELANYLKFREIKILIGVRRSGKSTLFYQFIDQLLRRKVHPKQILLVNFEDDVLSKKTLREIFDVYQSNVNPDTKPYLFLDEVHRCPEWALFLRKIYDLRQVEQVFITDSSSKFIRSEYAQTITGRNIKLVEFPLSFKEYLKWKNIEFDAKLATRQEINKVRKELKTYLEWGGFPEVFFKRLPINKKALLIEYLSDIIHKDLVERHNLNYSKIKKLTDFLVSNSGAFFSPRKYSRLYGLSLESIDTYLKYLEEVFLFHVVPKFDYSLRKQQIAPKKIYVCDTGFLNNVGFRFSENRGLVYENA